MHTTTLRPEMNAKSATLQSRWHPDKRQTGFARIWSAATSVGHDDPPVPNVAPENRDREAQALLLAWHLAKTQQRRVVGFSNQRTGLVRCAGTLTGRNGRTATSANTLKKAKLRAEPAVVAGSKRTTTYSTGSTKRTMSMMISVGRRRRSGKVCRQPQSRHRRRHRWQERPHQHWGAQGEVAAVVVVVAVVVLRWSIWWKRMMKTKTAMLRNTICGATTTTTIPPAPVPVPVPGQQQLHKHR